MTAFFWAVALPLACRATPAELDSGPEAEGEETGLEDSAFDLVECDPSADLVDASGACVQGPDCATILATGRGRATGRYTLDPDGPDFGEPPFEALCDMDSAGGGWTVLDLELIQTRGWMRFEHVAGEGSPAMGWEDEGAFVLAPQGARGCDTMALRATATLPLTFTEAMGSWRGEGASEGSQADDVHHRLRWGEVSTDCQGHLKFGTDQDTLKSGGEWGVHWTSRNPGGLTFAWGPAALAPTRVLRWELVDQGSPEDVRVHALWVGLR